jgi:hypothetical protein
MAQASPPDGGASPAGWSVSAGAESQSVRDISRGGPPVDASPVEWRGSGPSINIAYERPGERRFHRFTVDVSSAGSFAYVGPVQHVTAPEGDRLWRFEGRYEYRRYPLDDLFMRGLHGGIGVQGIGRRLGYTRGASTFAQQHNHETAAAIACVAAMRIDRWRRWWADIEWVNGISANHGSESLDIDPLADASRWGGGWLTDLSARVTVRLTGKTALTVSYVRADEGTMVSHNAYAMSRRRITGGVTYAR